jgi:hypothetical protein
MSKLKQILFSFFLLFFLFASFACKNQGQEVQTSKPNILWIFAEDLSPFLGCYGDSINCFQELMPVHRFVLQLGPELLPVLCIQRQAHITTGQADGQTGRLFPKRPGFTCQNM